MNPGSELVFVGPMERLLHLSTLAAFESVPPQALGALADAAEERVFQAGEPLYDRDRPADAYHVVVDGRVSCRRLGVPWRTVSSGQVVGLYHLLAREPESLDATAEVETLTLCVDWGAQLEGMETRFELLMAVLEHLARRSLGRGPGGWYGLHGDPGRAAASVESTPGAVERMLALRGCRTFRSEALDALYELARHVEPTRFGPAEVVYQAGAEPGAVRVVVAGTAVTEGMVESDFGSRSDDGRGAGLGAGGVALALPEVLLGVPMAHRIRARSELHVLSIDPELLVDVFEDHFDLSVVVLAELARAVLLGPWEEASGSGTAPPIR